MLPSLCGSVEGNNTLNLRKHKIIRNAPKLVNTGVPVRCVSVVGLVGPHAL